MQADRGLAGAGAALDHERPLGRARDQAVLVGLDRRDDVAHVGVAAALELLEQEVAHAGAVERRAVERLVRDVEQPAALRPEAAAQRHALRILRRRRVERSRGGRLPVDDHLLALVVVHPAAADVERALDGLEVEAAEHQAALGVLERREPLRRPRVERRLRDLAVGGVAGPQHDVPHALEARVGAVDVRLLGCQLRMAHCLGRALREDATVLTGASAVPIGRCSRSVGGRAVRKCAITLRARSVYATEPASRAELLMSRSSVSAYSASSTTISSPCAGGVPGTSNASTSVRASGSPRGAARHPVGEARRQRRGAPDHASNRRASGAAGAPMWARPSLVITRPRGVRWRKPSWSR